VIFSRGRGGRGRHPRDEDERPTGRHAAGARDRDPVEEAFVEEPVEDLVEESAVGPYDVSDAPSNVQRIDLGSLQLLPVDGAEVRVQADQDGVVQQVALIHRGSALQLNAFAAPRTSGIWDEVRAEIRASLANAQTVRELPGAYGIELHARVRTPDGPIDLRFIGIDGPRWMVQALLQTRVGADPAEAGPLLTSLEGLVVDRGNQAMPVREPLPLRLPRDAVRTAPDADRGGEPGELGESPEAPEGVDGRPVRRTPGGSGGSRRSQRSRPPRGAA
jgi:hypothetical protein